MPILFWILVIFITVAIAVMAFAAALDQRGERARVLRRRLASLEAAARRTTSDELDLLRDELLSEIPALNKLLARWSRSSRLQTVLAQADLKLRPGKFLLMSACIGSMLSVFSMLLASNNLLALLSLFFGSLLPIGYVYWRRARRFRRFEELFPEAIELLVRASRAGHPFNSAIELIANELAEPISGEFRQVFEENKFGLPIRQALLNFTERVPLLDVKFFVTAVMLQRETGGNLAEILEKLSYVIRERFKIMRQLRVYTAQGRLTMGLLMALPPSVVILISLVDTDLMSTMFTDPLGHVMIAVAATLQFIGFLLIRRIIDIKV